MFKLFSVYTVLRVDFNTSFHRVSTIRLLMILREENLLPNSKLFFYEKADIVYLEIFSSNILLFFIVFY